MNGVKKYNSLDVFKIIMSIFVIAIHTHPLEGCLNSGVVRFYGTFINTAVPFFFMVSGFFLASKLDWSTNSDNNNNMLVVRKYLIKIAKMYLIWSAIYLPLAICNYVHLGYSLIYSIRLYIVWLVFVGQHYNSWVLWFLLSTVYFSLLLLLLLKIHLKLDNILLIGLIFIIISIGIDKLVEYQESLPVILQQLKRIIHATCYNGRIFRGFFYIPLGMFVYRKKAILKYGPLFFIFGFFLTYRYLFDLVIGSLSLIILSIGLFCIILRIKLPDSSKYTIIRRMSTVIYLIHLYVWTIYYVIIYHEKTYGFDSFIVTTLICLIIAYISVFIKNKGLVLTK